MKIPTNKKTPTKKIIIISIIILALAASPFIYVYKFNGNIFGWEARKTAENTDNHKINNNPATKEQQQAGSKTESNSNSDTTPAPATIPGSDKKNVQVTITAANQDESILQIRALIGAVEDTGVCTLTLTSTGKTTITKTANIQALASTSACQGFDIPISELSAGTWHLLIKYSSSTLIGSTSQDKVIK